VVVGCAFCACVVLCLPCLALALALPASGGFRVLVDCITWKKYGPAHACLLAPGLLQGRAYTEWGKRSASVADAAVPVGSLLGSCVDSLSALALPPLLGVAPFRSAQLGVLRSKAPWVRVWVLDSGVFCFA
jgi:hypothetical protein